MNIFDLDLSQNFLYCRKTPSITSNTMMHPLQMQSVVYISEIKSMCTRVYQINQESPITWVYEGQVCIAFKLVRDSHLHLSLTLLHNVVRWKWIS